MMDWCYNYFNHNFASYALINSFLLLAKFYCYLVIFSLFLPYYCKFFLDYFFSWWFFFWQGVFQDLVVDLRTWDHLVDSRITLMVIKDTTLTWTHSLLWIISVSFFVVFLFDLMKLLQYDTDFDLDINLEIFQMVWFSRVILIVSYLLMSVVCQCGILFSLFFSY